METPPRRRDSAMPTPERTSAAHRRLPALNTSNGKGRDFLAHIGLTPSLPILHSNTNVRDDRIIHPRFDTSGSANQMTAIPQAPRRARISPKLAERLQELATAEDRRVLGKPRKLDRFTKPPKIEVGSLQQGWIGQFTPGALAFSYDIVRISLEGGLQMVKDFGRRCSFALPLGTVTGGLVSASHIRQLLAEQLGIEDQFSLQLFMGSSRPAPKTRGNPVAKGWRHYEADDSTPLNRILNVADGWIRVRMAQYLKLDIETLEIATAVTPTHGANVGQLRQVTAKACECEPEEIVLQLNELELDDDTVLLRTLQIKSKSVISVKLDGTECSSCMRTVSPAQFAAPITSACEHERQTCRNCVQAWIATELDANSWDRIACPECSKYLQETDVKVHATTTVYTRWERLATRAVLSAIPDFRWCMSPAGCEYGHIHNTECENNIFECKKCAFKTCATCERPWHEGETCEQYEKRTSMIKANEEASSKAVLEISKSCPKCKSRIQKNGGCDHMTCMKCHHEFCWQCFAAYKGPGGIRTGGNNAHAAACPYHSGNIPAAV